MADDERASLLPQRHASNHPTDGESANLPEVRGAHEHRERVSGGGSGSDSPDRHHGHHVKTSPARAKWRQTTARIIHAHRVHDAIGEALERHEPGAAPGIDPRRSIYQHLAAKWCLPATVTVVDYDAKSVDVRSGLAGAEPLRALLSQPRPRSARVRWIHVDGLNWEVVQLLALTYDLHPLALEDTVHVPQRIKADFYDCCLYMSLIYLYLAPPGGGPHHYADAPHSHATHALGGGGAGAGNQHVSHHGTGSHGDARGVCGHGPAHGAVHSGAVGGGGGGSVRFADMPAAVGRSARGLLFPTISSAERGGAVGMGVAAASAMAGDAGTGQHIIELSDGGDGDAHLGAKGSGAAVGGGGGGGGARRRHVSAPGPSHYPLALHHGAPPAAAGPAAAIAVAVGGATGAPSTAAAAAAAATATATGGGGGNDGIHVSAQQVSLFLLRGEHANTLLTVFQSDGSAVTRPILAQLREPRTLVREAEDASFLANLVIDTLVDNIFPVVGAYRDSLQRHEAQIAGGGLPSAAATRELHAMQRDLRRIDRTIAPLQAVVSNMVARDATAVDAAVDAGGRRLSDADGTPGAAAGAAASSARLALACCPFLSRLTRTYLGDVRDHVATICEDLVSLSAECGDLVGLIFNLNAHRQSQSTQTLAVVSTIFLPITFLAGVYGMNFDTLPELHWPHGYAYFWLTSAAIVLVFMGVMLRAGLWSW